MAVVMRVNVHEAGGDDPPGGVDLLGPHAVDAADGGDQPVLDGHVAGEGRRPGAIDDQAVTDHAIVLHACLPLAVSRVAYIVARQPTLPHR